MRVSDYMTPNPLTISPADSLRTAIDQMVKVGRRLPVINDQGELVGIITDRDLRLVVNSPLILRERWQDEVLLTQTNVGAIMSSPVITIEPDAWVDQAAKLMLDSQISGLPVVKANKLVGIITVSDLLRALTALMAKEEISQDKKFLRSQPCTNEL